jgi:hypothetical protein
MTWMLRPFYNKLERHAGNTLVLRLHFVEL